MTERQWFWYAGRNDETCQVGPCRSREEAIGLALSDDIYTEIDPDAEHPEWRVSIYLTEATKHELEDIKISDAGRILEHLSEDVYYDWLDPDDDGNLFDYTPEQERDLSARLTSALHQWARHHKLAPKSFMFRDMRNSEWVVLPHPDNVRRPDRAAGRGGR